MQPGDLPCPRKQTSSDPVREESTLNRESLALRTHQVTTGDLQQIKGGCHLGSLSPYLEAIPTPLPPSWRLIPTWR